MPRYTYTFLLYRNTGQTHHERQSDQEVTIWEEISEHPTLEDAKAAVGPKADWTGPHALPIPAWATSETEYIQEFEYYSLANTRKIYQHSILTDEALLELMNAPAEDPIAVKLKVRQPVDSEARNAVVMTLRLTLNGVADQTGLSVAQNEVPLRAIMQDLFNPANLPWLKRYIAEIEQESIHAA